MARLKTAYRPNIPAETEPEIKIDGERPEATVGMGAHIPGEDGAVNVAVAEAVQADEAALALQRQIDALQQSEQLQRQHRATWRNSGRATINCCIIGEPSTA